MQGRFPSRPAVYASGFALGGIAASVMALNAGDQGFGLLPAAMSPVGFWAVVGAVCFGLAGGVLWTSAGRRMDVSFAGMESALLVIGALTNSRVVQRLRDVFPATPRYLPTRVSLVATRDGVEVWGRPGKSHFLTIPWREIESISAGVVAGLNRTFTAISFDLGGSRPALEIPVTGTSVTGLSSPTRARVAELANELTQLKSQFDRTEQP